MPEKKDQLHVLRMTAKAQGYNVEDVSWGWRHGYAMGNQAGSVLREAIHKLSAEWLEGADLKSGTCVETAVSASVLRECAQQLVRLTEDLPTLETRALQRIAIRISNKLTPEEQVILQNPGPWPLEILKKLSTEECKLLGVDDIPF